MKRKYILTITRPIRIGKKLKRPCVSFVLECVVCNPDYNETDIAKMLFAIEMAANAHCELPLRVHINEEQ